MNIRYNIQFWGHIDRYFSIFIAADHLQTVFQHFDLELITMSLPDTSWLPWSTWVMPRSMCVVHYWFLMYRSCCCQTLLYSYWFIFSLVLTIFPIDISIEFNRFDCAFIILTIFCYFKALLADTWQLLVDTCVYPRGFHFFDHFLDVDTVCLS